MLAFSAKMHVQKHVNICEVVAIHTFTLLCVYQMLITDIDYHSILHWYKMYWNCIHYTI